MKNLELKVQLDQENVNRLTSHLQPYYFDTLFQTDTYFATKQGRLKLREENGTKAYFIRYRRPDVEEAKESDYLFFPIHDVALFFSVFGDSLREELKVKKERKLYFPKPHIRVHIDRVETLGNFLEIEIILSNDVTLEVAETHMKNLKEWLQLEGLEMIKYGYRELLQKSIINSTQTPRDFKYYKNQNKVFWVIADDLEVGHFKRYDIVPCIFVERFDDESYGIIQLDPTIANDHYQYTAWRKLIGKEHDFRAEVLLIDTAQDKLYTLKGKEIRFESLSRSSRLVDKSYLAPFATIES